MYISNDRKNQTKKIIKCYCNLGSCHKNKTCYTNGFCYQYLKFKLKNKKKIKIIEKGCSTNDKISLSHCASSKHNLTINNFFCCKQNYCNQLTSKNLSIPSYSKESYDFIYFLIFIIFIPIIIKKNYKNYKMNLKKNDLNDYQEMCNKESLYQELNIIRLIKKSKFKESYEGKRFSENLFVKYYKKESKKLWLNEKKIYELKLLRHENLVEFVCKDANKLMIITIYYPLGSLTNYLEKNKSIDELTMIKLMVATAKGIKHLHQDINFKPSIAHRNLNSDNFIVLLYPELTCKLTNFSSALIIDDYEKDKEKNNLKKYKKIVSQIKYCPPEYLNNHFNEFHFKSFLMADVYSFSLVLWQILNLTYKLTFHLNLNNLKPYDEYLIKNTNIQKQIIKLLKDDIRPTINFELNSSFFKLKLFELLKKSWSTNPNCRYSISKITNDLIALESNYSLLNQHLN